ncbi:HNH endonuclease [Pseudomonas sp. MUP55]|uniref:HNH endonuclease n=1 Tax=Pseudomonas sp. MUP55 TaxID=3087234 RepID=UPI002A5A3919|nr:MULTISPECIES: HNH endonuclease [unclassified Pseudomonas]WPN95153.1 HNH endonuclease [Pseudomonas sp. MUP56]WPO00682.1 HNH endonuclease [Pseudomonas sp. MUP55]
MIRLARLDCPYPLALENRNYKHSRNKEALLASTHGKCMYCESKVLAVDYGDVEHIRPKAEGKFPHLEFEWSNLGISCARCNGSKSDKFDEAFPYVNPFEEEPSEYLVSVYSFVFAFRGNERGQLTINDLGLNRPELVERRKTHVDNIREVISAVYARENPELRRLALAELIKEAAPDREYSFAVTALLREHGVIDR